MPKKITNAKIACLDFSLQKAKMHLGVQVLVEDPEKLDAIRARYYQFISSLLYRLFGKQNCDRDIQLAISLGPCLKGPWLKVTCRPVTKS